jgi:hypothetical protein
VLGRAFDEAGHRGGVAHVEGLAVRAAPARFHRSHRFVHAGLAARAQRDKSAFAGQCFGDCTADAATGAGDQRTPAVEFQVHLVASW